MTKRSEQTRILTKRMVTWTALVLAAFTLAFCVVAMAFDRFVSPALGEAVANVVSPWTYASSFEMGHDDSSMSNTVSQKSREVKADVARNYVNLIVEDAVPDADKGLEVPKAGEAADGSDGSSALVAAIHALQDGSADYGAASAAGEAGASDVLTALSTYVSPYGLFDSDNVLPANQEAAYLVSVARDTDFADAREQGLTLSDDVSLADSSRYYGASDAIMSVVKMAVDLRNSGAAASVRDGVWLITKGWYASGSLDTYYAEAQHVLAADISQKVVYSTIGSGATTEEVVYADGHGMWRDLTAYNQIKQLKLPVAMVLYLVGCLVIMAFAVRKSLGYFDTLFESVGAVLSRRKSADDAPELPSELAIAQKTIDDIRLRNDLDERAAEAAERRKNELVAYLAHDTKTPLTSITGYLSLLEEAPDMPVEQRERYAHTALQKAYRLNDMLDEFFEITRYNLHAMTVEREHVDPALLCFQVAEEFYPEASARGIRIEVDAKEGDEVFADARKLSRALSNVVKNAVAYADANTRIHVEMRITDDGKDGRTLRMSVANRGREISKEHLDRIFDKFYREDDARATNQGGAGLGLAIAREIVQAHGGSISAASENGRTVFTFAIPAGE